MKHPKLIPLPFSLKSNMSHRAKIKIMEIRQAKIQMPKHTSKEFKCRRHTSALRNPEHISLLGHI